jgi:hypothetical protein
MTYVYMDDSTSKEKFYSSVIDQEPQPMIFHIDEEKLIPGISLENALEPLVEFIPKIFEKAAVAKQNSKNPSDGLSCDESAAIYLFSMRWEPHDQCLYFILNATLHNHNYAKVGSWKLYLKLLFTALDRLRSNRITFRQDIEHDRTRRLRKDNFLVFWGLTSCSLSIPLPQKFNQTTYHTKTRTVFVFECRNAKYIARHSSDPSRNEFLLLPTQFQFFRYLDRRNDIEIIQVRDCNTSPPLIDFVDVFKYYNPLNPCKKVPQTTTTAATMTTTAPLTSNISCRNSKLQRLIGLHQSHSQMNLTYQNLTADDIPMIIEQAIVGKECTQLLLDNNHITFECMSILLTALPNNTTLKELHLQETGLHDMSVQILAQTLVLNNSSIKTLNLRKNNITDQGARYLTEMLKVNTTVNHLHLFGNPISKRGAKLLIDVTGHYNKCVRQLDLESNESTKLSCLRAIVNSTSCINY